MDKNREQTLLIIAGVVIAAILICGVGSLFIGLFGAARFVMAPAAISVLPLTPTTAVSTLPPPLNGTEWVLVSLNGRSPLPENRLTLLFSNGEVTGYSGCNWYNGAYTATAQSNLTIPEVASTARDCPEIEGVLAQEAAFQEALWTAAGYQLQGDQLAISNAEGKTTLVFEPLLETAVSATTTPPPATVTEIEPDKPMPVPDSSTYILWQQTDESGHCRQAQVGGDWLEVSACDGGDEAIVYALSANRQEERLQLTAAYTSFEADTKDGRVAFYAEDGLYASPAEARLIAAWVAGLVQEAETGQTPETPLVLQWQRQPDEPCPHLHVTLSGVATAFSCDNGAAITVAQQDLVPEKLGQLFDLYDRLGNVRTEQFTFAGQGSAATTTADIQAIERLAEGVFATLSFSVAAEEGVAMMPVAQADYIRSAGWSPDSRWFAYWHSTAEDVARQENPIQPPPGTLTFINVETEEQCAMPAFNDKTQAPGMAWTADNRVVVYLDAETVSGLPCQPDSFAVDKEAPAQATVTPDPRLSEDGRYRVETEILDETTSPILVRTTMLETASGQPLHTVEWQSPGYVDGCCAVEWVSSSQYLIRETMERPLLIDAERGVLDVPLNIFNVQPLPPDPNNNLMLFYALALPAAERDQFHLLLTARGSFSEAFPAMLLYHAESDLVETLPAGWSTWNFSPTSEWLHLSEEIGTGQLVSRDRRSAGYNLWARRLEDVEGQWQLIATAVDAVLWNEDQSEVAFVQNKSTVTWQTFPEGKLLDRWQADPYSLNRVFFAPNGRYLVTEGSVPGLLDHALFVHERGAGIE